MRDTENICARSVDHMPRAIVFCQGGSTNGMADFRIALGFTRHHKTQRLIRAGGHEAAWALVCLLEYAAGHRPTGDLSGLDDADIAVAAQWRGDAPTFVASLRAAGYLDGDEGAYRIHDYAEHQPYVSTRPQRRAAAQAAVNIRWHRAGKHALAVDGCPLCVGPVHSHAVRSDTNRSSYPDTKDAENRYGSDTNSIRTRYGSDTNSIRTDTNSIRTDTKVCMHTVSEARSKARRGNVLVRWHRAGKHAQPVDGCPDCYPDTARHTNDTRDTNDTNSIRTRYELDTNSIRTDTNSIRTYEPRFVSDTNGPLPERVSEIDALRHTERIRPYTNRNTPDPDPYILDRMSDVVETARPPVHAAERPPSGSDFGSDFVPDQATAAKLNDTAVHEWQWNPLTQPQTLRAIQLQPFSARELAEAKRVCDERDAGRANRNKLGLLLAVVERIRGGGGNGKTSAPLERKSDALHRWREKLSDKDDEWLRAHVAWCRAQERTGDAERAAAELKRIREEWLTRKGQDRANEILR